MIGRRFQVLAPIEKVVDSELERITSEETKAFLNEQRSVFVGIFNASGIVSLRVLKRAIREVVALIDGIDFKDGISKPVVSNACQQLFICSTIFMGGVDPLTSLISENRPNEDDDYVSKLDLANQYGSEVFISALPDDLVYDRVVKGHRDPVRVQNEIENVSGQQTDSFIGFEEWRTLSSHDTISDVSIIDALTQSLQLLGGQKIIHLGLIAHFASIFMLHSKTGLYQSTYEEIENLFVQYVVELVEVEALQEINFFNENSFGNNSWGGYSFYVLEEYRPYFSNFIERVKAEILQIQQDFLSQDSAKILDNKDSAEELYLFLSQYRSERGGSDLDALVSIEPSAFFTWLVSLPRQELGKLFSDHRLSFKNVSSEEKRRWLRSLISVARNEYLNLDPSKSYTMSRFFRFVIGVELDET